MHDLFNRPQHPYTWGLMGSLPRLDADVERLTQIPGQPPSLLQPTERLPLPSALPVRDGGLQDDRARARSDAARSGPPAACHLDEETKEREAAKLLAATMAEAG